MSIEQPAFDTGKVADVAEAAVKHTEQLDSTTEKKGKPFSPRKRSEQADKLESEGDEKKLTELSSAIEEQTDPAQDKAFADELERKIEGVDGEQVLREAVVGLSPLYREVFNAGLQGPPPVEQKDLGTTCVKMSLAAAEMGDALKASEPPSMAFIISIIMKRAATPACIVRCFIEGRIEDVEGVQPKEEETDPNFTTAIKKIRKKYNNALKPAEQQAQKDFKGNMRRFLEKGKAEGRNFMTERERKDAAEGGGYVLNWVMGKAFEEIGIYKDFEKMGKEEASPVSVLFEQPAQASDVGPNLVMKQKNGKNAKAFVEQVSKAIGNDRVKKSSGDKWMVKEITAKELEKVGKILQTMIRKTDPKIGQRV